MMVENRSPPCAMAEKKQEIDQIRLPGTFRVFDPEVQEGQQPQD